MAVAFDASSESHTGTAGSTSAASFSWAHTTATGARGVLVYTFVNANADNATAVTFGGIDLTAVGGGRAVDTAGEPGDCKAWFLSQRNITTKVTAWSKSASGSANQLAYGAGKWVGVGGLGKIVTTADPAGAWADATSPGFSTTAINDVAYGNGYWVAVGASGKLRYATDPAGTWSAASDPGFGTSSVETVSYGNGYWVACSTTSVRYATDPTGTWTAVGSIDLGSNQITAVTYVGGYWVITGIGGTIRYATDPTGTWSTPSSVGFGAAQVNAVGYDGTYWVAVANGGLIRYTTNPTGTWTGNTSSGLGSTDIISCVHFADGYWVLGGTNSNTNNYILRYATDPTGSWTQPPFYKGNGSVGSLGYGDGAWAACASVGIIYARGGMVTEIPSGTQTVVITRTNNANEMYAVAITLTGNYGLEVTGVTAVSADPSGGTVALAATSVDDGSPGTNSLRFAGLNSGLADVPTANSGTTNLQSIDFGQRVIVVAGEDAAGQGSRNIGWTGASDDVAAVYLAIREAIVPWTVGVPIR